MSRARRRRAARLAAEVDRATLTDAIVEEANARALDAVHARLDAAAGLDVEVPPSDPVVAEVIRRDALRRGVDIDDPAWQAAARARILDYLDTLADCP